MPVLIALWFGLSTGLIESTVVLVQREVLGHFIWASLDVLWMAPVSYALFFALPGVLLFLVTWQWPRAMPPVLAPFLFATLGAISLLFLLAGNHLHPAARIVLALGLASQVAWPVRRRPEVFHRLVRRSLPALLAVVASLGVAVAGGRVAAERLALGRLPSSGAGAPNVLLIILDSVRAISMSLYGYTQPTTPNLDRWAERGAVFDLAIVTAPWTLPSHASMFTGRWPHELSTGWFSALDDQHPTIAEAFRDRGYYTAALTANYFYTTRETGLHRGFLHFDARPISFKQVLLSSVPGQALEAILVGHSVSERFSDRKNAERLTTDALNWIDANESRPCFLFLNYFDAHQPYQAAERFRTRFGRHRANRGGYDAALATMDQQVDRLLSELARRGTLENTIVVITSDHGETFGEHGLRGHGHSLYLPLLQVPLVITYPARVPPKRRIANAVSLRDLAATLSDLAELQPGRQFAGKSLARYWNADGVPVGTEPAILSEVWEGRNRLPENQPASKGEMVSFITESLHYIRDSNGKEELFDLTRDRGETRNLAGSGAGLPPLAAFRGPALQALKALDQAIEARIRGNPPHVRPDGPLSRR